jgi:hypothetical protein
MRARVVCALAVRHFACLEIRSEGLGWWSNKITYRRQVPTDAFSGRLDTTYGAMDCRCRPNRWQDVVSFAGARIVSRH